MTVLGRSRDHAEAAQQDSDTMPLLWGMATDVGRTRSHNEDSLVVSEVLFAVADGMGGHAAGDVASDAVVSRLADLAVSGPLEQEGIVEALRGATADLAAAVGELASGAGTTVTGAALTRQGEDPYWIVFNVGDSRLYLYEGEALSQITVDHSVVQELVAAGLISPDDAEHHPDSNVVTRAVGFSSEPEPDFWLLPVTPGSRLLLCSDGLTREVGDEELSGIVAAGASPQATAEALVDAALASGGRDNVTAVVVEVPATDLGP